MDSTTAGATQGSSSSEESRPVATRSSVRSSGSRGSSGQLDPNDATITYASSPAKEDALKQAALARSELVTHHLSSSDSKSSSTTTTTTTTTTATATLSPTSPSLVSSPTSSSSSTPTAVDCLRGVKLSKFTGFYNPQYTAAFVGKSRESPQHVDPELTRMLKQEFDTENIKLHKKKDWMKTYSDEAVKYAACARKIGPGGSGGGKE